jgi:hypothetical protein
MALPRPLFHYLISPENPENTTAIIVALSVSNNTISVYLEDFYTAGQYLEYALKRDNFMADHNVSFLHREDSGHYLLHTDNVAELDVNHYHLVHNETIDIKRLNQFLNTLRSGQTAILSELPNFSGSLITESIHADILKKFREYYKQQNAKPSESLFDKVTQSLKYYYQKIVGTAPRPTVKLTGNVEVDALLLNAGETTTFSASNLAIYDQLYKATGSMPTIPEHAACLDVPQSLGCTPGSNFLTPSRFLPAPVVADNNALAGAAVVGVATLAIVGLFNRCLRQRRHVKPSVIDTLSDASSQKEILAAMPVTTVTQYSYT